MKKQSKSTARSNRAPLNMPAEQWPQVDVAILALGTVLAPALQPLTESERRELLHVAIANEAFTADYVALADAEPGLIPAGLRPADTARDWQTRAQLIERRQAVAALLQQMDDTIAGLQSDCFASALIGYRYLTQGGTPPGMDPAVEPLRAHWAQRLARKNETRARNLALKAAESQAPAPTPATQATLIPLGAANGAAASVRNGAAGALLAP